jgi:predicted DsbA family dithiol-disulfide isomerase
MSTRIKATLFSDPSCPWAYSASPALRVIEWRYGDQIDWDLVLIGLSEDPSRYARSGHTALRMAQGQLDFRDRYGMPFGGVCKPRLSASARACRTVIAARQNDPGSEWAVFRGLQLANFNTTLLFDEDDELEAMLDTVPGVDAAALVAAIDRPEVLAAYEDDKRKTRSAASTPAALQGKTANSDGDERYTAPSVIFETIAVDGGEAGGQRLIVGGFQPVEVYDAAVANLDPGLDRRQPPEGPLPLLEHFPLGLSTQEVAALLAPNLVASDRQGAERALLELLANGTARRYSLGNDAIWALADATTTVPGIQAA